MTLLDIMFDMETNDPDDFLTLLLLAGHPQVNLKAVTILPGTPAQVGLVRRALNDWFKLDIPVGAGDINSTKQAVSDWHFNTYGEVPPSHEAQPAADVLRAACDAQTHLITGAPLNNVARALERGASEGAPLVLHSITVQGGFAGEGVVPGHLQLPKFKGLTTFPTYNLSNRKAAERILAADHLGVKRFVSKNVCHRVAYDQRMYAVFAQVKDRSRSLELIYQGMDQYLRKNPQGKLLHDPLAACCAIDPTIATWAEVELYSEKGAWGARLAPGSGIWIIIDYNHERFIELLTAT